MRAEKIEAIAVRGARSLRVKTVAHFGSIATCRARPEQLVDLSVARRIAPAVAEVCSGRCATRLSAARRDAGHGVVMAFLDWGIDVTHRAFRDARGATRLAAIWDQRGGAGNNRYGYGTVYRRSQIDEALRDDDPFAALGYAPQRGARPAHGTHVADIAAGSCASVLGLAPGAELVFVHLAPARPEPDTDAADSVRIIEALDFAVRAAGDRPLVIHLSVGRTGGPVERAVDHLLKTPGRAVIRPVDVDAHLLSSADPGGWQIVLRTEPAPRAPREPVEASTNAIAVGAVDARGLESRLADYSSIATSRDGRVADVVAPGVAVRAARSAIRGTREGTREVVAMSGAAMASAHVAGCVAAMFSAASPRRLSIADTRRLLRGERRSHPTLDADLIGCLDIAGALSAAERW